MIDFDKILDKVGAIGTYQIVVFFILGYSGILSGLTTIGPVFQSYTPNYRCNVGNHTIFENATEQMILNATTPLTADGSPADPCVMYKFDLTGCGEGDDLSCISRSDSTVPCGQGYHFDDDPFAETVVTEFELVCDRRVLKSITSSCLMFGKFVGSLVAGVLADRYGRRPVIIFAAYGVLSTMLIMYFLHSIEVYSFFAFIVGALNMGGRLIIFVHVVEMVGTRWRAIFSVAFQITYVSGYILWSVVGYVWRDWHSNQMACFIICSPFAALVLIPPESARWLFAHGKNDEGKKVSKMIGRFNKKPLSNEVWSEVEASLENTQVDKTDQAQHTILDLFRSPILRIVTLKVFFVWPVVTMVYYGIAFNAGSLAGNIFLNNIWGGLLEMSSYALCGLTMDFFGRRLLIGITLTGSGIALVATAIVNEYADESHGLATLGVALAFAGKAFASGAFALVFTFTAELFPTSVRSNAIGFASTTARIGGIMAPFIISLQHYVTWIPNTMLGGVALMGGLVSLTIRDTTGHTMMETLEEAEIFHSGKSEPARRYDAKTI